MGSEVEAAVFADRQHLLATLDLLITLLEIEIRAEERSESDKERIRYLPTKPWKAA